MSRVRPLKETTIDPAGEAQLWLQWCRFESDEEIQFGYRYIWKQSTGELLASRGQTRIPNLEVVRRLLETAQLQGWGNRDGLEMQKSAQRLKDDGFVVNLATGYVGWPDSKSAKTRFSDEQSNNDALRIHEWA